MELNKHSFPVEITLEEAISIFQKEFDKKGHKVKITKDNIHLNITPYWVCFYDIDCNKEGNYQHISAQTALNSLTNKIEEGFLKLLEVSTPEIIDTLGTTFEKIDVRIKKSLVNQAEAQETIIKMLSCKYNVDKKNISLSGFEEMYIPIWRCNSDNLELHLDGVIGKVNNFNIISKRIKSGGELFSEMLNDLKDPKKLFGYIIELFVNIFKAIISAIKWAVKNWYITLIVIGVLVILYFIFL